MRYEIPASMREALNATRAGNPAEATRVIQRALSGASNEPVSKDSVEPINASKIDRSAETIEPDQSWRGAEILRKAKALFPLGEMRTRKIAVPDGADWQARANNQTGGAGNYRLFVPSEAPLGLIVMLHGCTQDPEDFAVGTGMNEVAQRNRLLVAYPQQPKSANAHACWNWFEPGHQRRDAGEPAALADIVRQLSVEYDLPPRSAMIAGLSAGGAMAAVMAEVYPELFGAAGIHSGLACGAARDVSTAFAVMRSAGGTTGRGQSDVPTFIIHGSADATVHPGNADALSQSIGLDSYRLTNERVSAGGRTVATTRAFAENGSLRHERWTIDGAGHAWSGGNPAGSFTDTTGPNASVEMIRFFREVAKVGEGAPD